MLLLSGCGLYYIIADFLLNITIKYFRENIVNNIVEETLRVCSEYKFSDFGAVASATNDATMSNNKDFESCPNHLDKDFMNCLKNGDHLNLDILPL